jgi:hypothetical protein
MITSPLWVLLKGLSVVCCIEPLKAIYASVLYSPKREISLITDD